MNFLNEPFWMKMFSVTLFVGMTFFMWELFKVLDGWNIKLRQFVNDCYTNYINDIKKWRN